MDSNSKLAVETLHQPSVQLLVSEFGFTETLNAFYQRCFRTQFRRSEADRLAARAESDVDSGFLLLRGIPETAYVRARLITAQWTADFGTRTGDVLHVASSIEMKSDVLLTFDKRQRRLSEKLGLKCLP